MIIGPLAGLVSKYSIMPFYIVWLFCSCRQEKAFLLEVVYLGWYFIGYFAINNFNHFNGNFAISEKPRTSNMHLIT